AMFRDLEKSDAAHATLSGLAAHVLFGANVSAHGDTSSESGLLVSGSYFPTLGLAPAIGRLLTPDDDRVIGESHVVVLSHVLWRKRFGQDPNVLNTPVTINGQTMTVVGVAPQGFDGTTLGARPDVFVPITMRGFMQPNFKGLDDRRAYWAYLFGRLKPGVSIEQAQSALNAPYRTLLNDVEAPLQKGM